jgi:membrane dipeptidase
MAEHVPFIDLHVHFPMHTRFPPMPFEDPFDGWKKPLFDAVNGALNYEGLQPRASLPHWFADDPDLRVSGLGSALYDPADELLVKTGAQPTPAAIDHLCAQLCNVEAELAADGRVMVARNPKVVERYVHDRRPFVFHTVEGGFGLGGSADHVTTVARLGVASLVPAHLLYRGVATCETGVPPLAEPFFAYELAHQPHFGLSSTGEAIVEECFRKGVIVDITHARGDAQARIFEIASGYPNRPVISSHNSVRQIFDAGLNLSDEALLKIKATNGVVGVIFYTHWLRRPGLDLRSDVRLITDVIDHIRLVTGSDEHVAIGSDLDGFIEPISMCSNYSKMSRLAEALLHCYPRITAEKILYRNALRVLCDGWTGV